MTDRNVIPLHRGAEIVHLPVERPVWQRPEAYAPETTPRASHQGSGAHKEAASGYDLPPGRWQLSEPWFLFLSGVWTGVVITCLSALVWGAL